MTARIVHCLLRAAALVSPLVLAVACGPGEQFSILGSTGHYQIVSHLVRSGCEAPPQIVPDGRCVRVTSTEIGGLRLGGCPNTDTFHVNVELQPRGREYVSTQIETERCVDLCIGGVTTGCTADCAGGQSCDATAVLYEAVVDFDEERVYLEMTTHAKVQIPQGDTDRCDADFARTDALQMPCFQVDELEAVFVPNPR